MSVWDVTVQTGANPKNSKLHRIIRPWVSLYLWSCRAAFILVCPPWTRAFCTLLLSVLTTHQINTIISPACCSSTPQKTGVGPWAPLAGGERAQPACRPADASCARRLRPPGLLPSCRAGRPAAAGRRAAASPARPRRTSDTASALHCPVVHTGNTFSLISHSLLTTVLFICDYMPVSTECRVYMNTRLCFVCGGDLWVWDIWHFGRRQHLYEMSSLR